MINELLHPFRFDFFVDGLMAATLAGALCGLVGTYVVLRGMSYIGHGLSHAIFGGFALSAAAGLNLFVGAGVWGFGSAMVIARVTRRRPIGSDAAIGVVTTASFALGVALIALYGSGGKNPDALLFGQILGVDNSDVVALALVLAASVAVVACWYRPLLFCTFDPEVAGASGVPVARVDALFTVMLAASVLASMTILGVTLVAATLVIPAVVARMLTDSFARMLVLATAIGAGCGFVGMVLSYHLDIPSGPMIVLVGSAAFTVVYAVTGLRGRRRVAGSAVTAA
ncbi:MAG: metal ABC transporter permease [Acidimicrobiia bacterium]